MIDKEPTDRELTPVDDVRRVRERLHRDFGGDIRKQAEHARQVTEKLSRQLGLKLVSLPPRKDRTGTQG